MRTLLRRLRCMSLLDTIHLASCAPATRLSHDTFSLAVPQAPPPSRRREAARLSHAVSHATASAVGEASEAGRASRCGFRLQSPAEYYLPLTAKGSALKITGSQVKQQPRLPQQSLSTRAIPACGSIEP